MTQKKEAPERKVSDLIKDEPIDLAKEAPDINDFNRSTLSALAGFSAFSGAQAEVCSDQ